VWNLGVFRGQGLWIVDSNGNHTYDGADALFNSFGAAGDLPVMGPWTSGGGSSPDLTVTKTHTGNFTQGQVGAAYTITVSNSGTAATSGMVSVSESLPSGLTATAMSGSGWSCTQPGGPCTRSDALAAGSNYPTLTLTVNVAGNAPPSVTNTATVAGGGETNTGNNTASDATIINPAGTTVDPRRIGVRTTGAYWGAAGEQIDLFSGNLNFSLPLMQAQGRGSAGAAFVLSYNSQFWKQNSGVTSNLGRDVGYGFGWTLQAGSVSPEETGYIFRDATGAEYRLDHVANGVWTSWEGTFVSFAPGTARLSFPDGSFWTMSAVSSAGEADAGTMYPVLIQDSNGNQVMLEYARGAGAANINTSARITGILDVRATGGARTYNFTSPTIRILRRT
jgi:uncharacterized repeat protein (TIGR01451 family)